MEDSSKHVIYDLKKSISLSLDRYSENVHFAVSPRDGGIQIFVANET